MRLALIIDDYLPHSTRVAAKMFHELALEFQSQGHEVIVITPDDKIAPSLVIDEVDGVPVWRFKSGKIKDVGNITRAINETLLSFKAWKAIKHQVKNDTFDGIVYYSPSIFFGWLVRRLKAYCGCPAYLVLRDLFPQWVIDAGMIRESSPIAKYFRFFERLSYRQANTIGLMSENNLKVFRQAHPAPYPCHILRNWASLSPHVRTSHQPSIRHKLGLEDKTIFFYGGNIGHAQDMANLMRLARGLNDDSRAHFLFVGQGDEVDLVNNLAQTWQLNNFTYLPSVNQNDFKDILAEVDIGLFSLSVKHTAHNFPGKLLGYMVQSIPLLGSVNPGNDLKEIVNDNFAGLTQVNGEDDALLESAQTLLNDLEVRQQLGEGAYRLLEQQFSIESAASLIIEKLAEAQCQISKHRIVRGGGQGDFESPRKES